MVFSSFFSRVTIPNVNIGDGDYTIAFWIRLFRRNRGATIAVWSRSGKLRILRIFRMSTYICRGVSTRINVRCVGGSSGVAMKNWIHVAVTRERNYRVKVFFNGERANITRRRWPNINPLILPPKETFVILYFDSPLIMDLHILGFALPRDEIYDLYRG